MTETRYRALEALAQSLVELKVDEDRLVLTLERLKRRAQKALDFKEQPRNVRLDEARVKAREATIAQAKAYRAQVMPHVVEAQQSGAKTMRQIADWLNEHDIKTARGNTWSAGSVYRLINGS